MRSEAVRGSRNQPPLTPPLSPDGGEGEIAVAVSGGSDSLALMLLLAERKPAVLIVDHGLRAGSAKEARAVARQAEEVGLKAHILAWRGAKPKSNIEGRAREARYRLLGNWCVANGVSALFVAHTMDDLAETFLLRLARGSGVDGLSAMQPRAPFPIPEYRGVTLVRPLLDFTREKLRAYLTAHGVRWIEDPMNDDARFARARVRALWPTLEAAGLTRERIAAAAHHLARARSALETQTFAFVTAHSAPQADGSVLVDARAFKDAPREIGLRALAVLLKVVGGAAYRPRFESLESLYEAVLSGAPCPHAPRLPRRPRPETTPDLRRGDPGDC